MSETEQCDVCENEVHSSAIVHRNIGREEFDSICANWSHTILSLCKLDNIAIDRMKDSQDTENAE